MAREKYYDKYVNKAVQKYNKKAYDRVSVVVKKGQKEHIAAFAEAHGESLNGYINRLIAEDMAKNGVIVAGEN